MVYKFFGGELWDWYREIIKPGVSGGEGEGGAAIGFVGDVFERSLRLLSPFMPFITEEIWHAMYDGKPPKKSIALVSYPDVDKQWINDEAEQQMAILQELIVSIRNIRAEMKVEPKVKTPVQIHAAPDVMGLIGENRGMLERLANVDGVEFVDTSLAQTPGARATPRFEVSIVYAQKRDLSRCRDPLHKDLKKLEGELANGQRQLRNEQFLGKA